MYAPGRPGRASRSVSQAAAQWRMFELTATDGDEGSQIARGRASIDECQQLADVEVEHVARVIERIDGVEAAA